MIYERARWMVGSSSSSSLANGAVVQAGLEAGEQPRHEDARRDSHDSSMGSGGVAASELLLRFREACRRADAMLPDMGNAEKLALYGLFKQATDPYGRPPAAPSRLSTGSARAKWDAWHEVRQRVECRFISDTAHHTAPLGR